MRSKLLSGGLGVAVAFLLATNPLVAQAAGFITSADIVNSTIKGKDVKNESLKGKDVKDGSLTSSDLAAGTIPAGPVHLTASVTYLGVLTSGIGATNATRKSTGTYEVTFNRTIANCFANVTATVDQRDESVPFLEGSTVTVDIEDPDNADVQNDSSFFLTLVCPA